MSLTIHTLYFAHVRAKVGVSSEVFDVEAGSKVQDVLNLIIAKHPDLEALVPHLRVAFDGEFVGLETLVTRPGELVLIPPVAGGAPTFEAVHLTEEALGPAEVEAMAQALSADDRGALVTFEGRVRNHARGRTVTALFYEAYRPMALSQMRRIVAEVENEFSVVCAIHHRLGSIPIGENAVVAIAAHAHRAPAFAACMQLIERLKVDVPIWKHETDESGATWVTERP